MGVDTVQVPLSAPIHSKTVAYNCGLWSWLLIYLILTFLKLYSKFTLPYIYVVTVTFMVHNKYSTATSSFPLPPQFRNASHLFSSSDEEFLKNFPVHRKSSPFPISPPHLMRNFEEVPRSPKKFPIPHPPP